MNKYTLQDIRDKIMAEISLKDSPDPKLKEMLLDLAWYRFGVNLRLTFEGLL